MSNYFERVDAVCKLDLPRADKAVLKRLVERASKRNKFKCWPSIKSIRQDTGYADRTVQSALRRLEDRNFITRYYRKGKSTIFGVHPHLGLADGYANIEQKPHPSPAKNVDAPRNTCGETEKNNNLNLKNANGSSQVNANREELQWNKQMRRPAAPSLGYIADRLIKSLPPPEDWAPDQGPSCSNGSELSL